MKKFNERSLHSLRPKLNVFKFLITDPWSLLLSPSDPPSLSPLPLSLSPSLSGHVHQPRNYPINDQMTKRLLAEEEKEDKHNRERERAEGGGHNICARVSSW